MYALHLLCRCTRKRIQATCPSQICQSVENKNNRSNWKPFPTSKHTNQHRWWLKIAQVRSLQVATPALTGQLDAYVHMWASRRQNSLKATFRLLSVVVGGVAVHSDLAKSQVFNFSHSCTYASPTLLVFCNFLWFFFAAAALAFNCSVQLCWRSWFSFFSAEQLLHPPRTLIFAIKSLFLHMSTKYFFMATAIASCNIAILTLWVLWVASGVLQLAGIWIPALLLISYGC